MTSRAGIVIPVRRRGTVLSQFGASAPIVVMNVVLVEWVFSIPGFFHHMRRALRA